MEDSILMSKEEYLMFLSTLLGSIDSDNLVEQFGEETMKEVAVNLSQQVYAMKDPAEVAKTILNKAIDFLDERPVE